MTAKSADAGRVGLNEPQQRHLLVSCQHIDTLLSSIEAVLSASRSSSPFPRYRTALTPVQARLAANYLARIRSRLVRVLEREGIPIPPPQVDTLFAIRTALTFADNAVEELRPTYIAEHLRTEVGLDIAVHAVSAVGADATLTDAWFAAEIAPMCQRHQDGAWHSIHRKIVLLRDAVRASLQASADRGAGRVFVSAESQADAETKLRRAGALAANVSPLGEQAAQAVAGGVSIVLRQAAVLLVNDAQWAGLTMEAARSALGRAARDTVGAQAEELRIALGRFAAGLAASLARAADLLGRPETLTVTELLGRVRELPALVLPEVTTPLTAPGISAITRSLRIRAIERQFEAQIGQSLAEALSAFGVGLRGWMRDAVTAVQNGFHEYAEPLRVSIERQRFMIRDSPDSSGTDAHAIQEELAALDRVYGDEQPDDQARNVL
ncbi:MAG: hypothetical protein NTV05_03485 [Acidobacteria bacterium]|nr:hypothetical protein [Acidobacteriota bacterium]